MKAVFAPDGKKLCLNPRCRFLIGNKSGVRSKKPAPTSGQQVTLTRGGGQSSLDLIKSFLSGLAAAAAARLLWTMLGHASFRPHHHAAAAATRNATSPASSAANGRRRIFGARRKKRAKFLWFYWVEHVTHVFTELRSVGLTRYGTEGQR